MLRGRRLAPALALLASLLVAAPAADAYPNPMPTTQVTGGPAVAQDPSLLVRSAEPRYVLFSTPDNKESFSRDGLSYTPGVTGGPAPPAWWETDTLGWGTWAPDVSYHGGKYWMYYTRSTFGSHEAAIGVASSSTGDPGTWIDQGKVIESRNAPGGGPETGDRYRALDPNLFVDTNGKWYLVFGSFWDGIFIREAADNGKLLPGTALVNIAARSGPTQWQRPIEAPFLFKHNGKYYLFVSFDYCCQGADSTYNIRVGQATSILGPYRGKLGTDMLAGGGSMVLESHGNVVGPGAQSVVHDPITSRDLLVYHYYDTSRANAPVTLGINRLCWDSSDWPYVC